MPRYTTTRDRQRLRRTGRVSRRRRLGGMVAGFTATAVVTATAAYAVLSAIVSNVGGQAVSSGTLSLALGDNGAGFTQQIQALVPGDTVIRYVDVTNNGTVAAKDLTLALSASASNKLVNDATNGLRIAVDTCTGGTWNTTTNACSGSVGNPVTQTAWSGFGTRTLVSGAVAKDAVQRLRITLVLPDQTETTTNGATPANSIQGLANTLTYTFGVTQRDAASTNG